MVAKGGKTGICRHDARLARPMLSMGRKMGRSITKAQVIGELAGKAGVPKRRAAAVLEALAELVYRESVNGIIVPGLCKFEVVDRKPRRCRDPRTGAALVVGAHKGVRVRPVKRAKQRIAPLPPGIVQRVEVTPPSAPGPEVSAEPAQSVPFSCRHCGSEVEALPDMAGRNVPCPWCGAVVAVPSAERDVAPPVCDIPPEQPAVPSPYATEMADGNVEGFVYFQCESCGQEIEAPKDMAGTGVPCPACGNPLRVPTPIPVGVAVRDERDSDGDAVTAMDDVDALLLDEMKKRTIRIQLPRAMPRVPQKKIVFKR